MSSHSWTLLVALALCGAAANKPQPEVTSPAGTFRGKTLTSHSGADYASYRGIPYALPPTGDRRFALPVPHPAIEGVYDAGEFGSICLQNIHESRLGQEHCLFLNVYMPLSGQTTADADLKKVLVYIHGGGMVTGSSNPNMPGDLVTRGELVVVTINYRLGWMGLMRGNSSSLPGNVAYWDQVLALKWIRDNIRYFGGDASDVTLSGESAGSLSTSVLCISPLGKDLFNKAILLSGVATLFNTQPRTNNDLLQMAAHKFGCSVDSLPGHEDEVVQCLKHVPAEDFVADYDNHLIFCGTSTADYIIPTPIVDALNDPDYLTEVGFFNRHYLVSVTADDGYILVNSVSNQMDTTSFDSSVQKISQLLKLSEHVTGSVLLEYRKLFGNLDKSVTALITDAVFIKSSLDFLNAFKSRQENKEYLNESQAYFMSFDHIPKYVPNQYMMHALDLCYLFDLTPEDLITDSYNIEPEDVFNNEDLEMKAAFIDLVTDFVKTGNPGERLAREKGVAWPPFDINRKSYLSLSLQPSVGEDLLSDRRVIWEKLVPQWLKEEGDGESKQEL